MVVMVVMVFATILPEVTPHIHMGPEMVDYVMPCSWKRGCQILITIVASQIVKMLRIFTLKMAGTSERQSWTFTSNIMLNIVIKLFVKNFVT